MSEIEGIEGLSIKELKNEIDNGGRFIYFLYCFSIIIMTFNRTSNIKFVRKGESTFIDGLLYTLITIIFGWWGIPWGPIYSLESIFTNLSGGKDITNEVLQGTLQTYFEVAKYQELLQTIENNEPIKMEKPSSSERPDIVVQPDYKKCPFCAEDIKYEAIVCRYCGRDIPAVEKRTDVYEGGSRDDRKQLARERVKRVDEINREITSLNQEINTLSTEMPEVSSVPIVLLLLSIICGLFILLIIQTDYWELILLGEIFLLIVFIVAIIRRNNYYRDNCKPINDDIIQKNNTIQSLLRERE